jgi:hypothetical protein
MTDTRSALVWHTGHVRTYSDLAYKIWEVIGLRELVEPLQARIEQALTSAGSAQPSLAAEAVVDALVGDTTILDLFVELHALNAKTQAAEQATAEAYKRADLSRPTIAELLNRAAEIMEQSNGVCRGHFLDRDAGTYTAWGAIYDAVCDGPWTVEHKGHAMWPRWADERMRQADEFTLQALNIDIAGRDVDFYDGLFLDVPETMAWNDAPERTKADVTAMLRKAAEIARDAA